MVDDGIVASLDSLTAKRNLLNHFYQAWSAERLPFQRRRNYAVQYYHHLAAFSAT
jgi:hypothetical protein